MSQSLIGITLTAALSVSVPAPEPAPAAGPQPGGAPTMTDIGPVVHVVPHKPDPSRGVLKLVKHRSTTTQAVGTNAVLITQLYDEICTEPCGVPVDVSERPVFYFVRDGEPVSKGFRLSGQTGDVTIRVKPLKKPMYTAGLYLTAFLVLPVSIPLMVAASPKVWIATGTPQSHGDWIKLKKAKI